MDANLSKLYEPVQFQLTEIMKCEGTKLVKQSSSIANEKTTDESELSLNYSFEHGFNSELTKGLNNLGNTCYLNSVMQVLMNTPIFTKHMNEELVLKEKSHKCDKIGPNQVCFTCESLKICQALRTREISPNTLVSNLKYINKRFSGNKQQDAHEFYLLLLNKLDSKIKNHFSGFLKSNVKCRKNHISTTNEEFLNISLDIHQIGNLENAIKRYFNESAPIKNYLCFQCNARVDITKKYEWSKMPNYLVFHLNRFDRFANKITAHIDFDMTIKIADQEYILYGIVEHLGSSIDFGHYVSYVMNKHKIWNKVK